MHMDSLTPASPPSFSFSRITRRRRRSTNAGGPPPLQLGAAHPPPPPNDPPTGLGLALAQSLGSVGPALNPALQAAPATTTSQQANNAQSSQPQQPRSYRIRLVPHLENARSLHFDPIVRDVKYGGAPLRVGRFTDRQTNPPRGNGLNPNDRNSDKVAFRSKVVSRSHAELWVESGGQFYLKDTKSSSGTFINHMRLSPPGQESLAHLLKDGDVIQLGVDYQGGTEEMYRCVKIKVEVGQGREWQGGANNFNTTALKQLRALQGQDGDKPKCGFKRSVGDCCICLFAVTVCQSLFIAPCSHAFHYKCIRPMLELHHPGFSCPLCRTFADLEADVEVEAEDLEQEEDAADALEPADDSVDTKAKGLPAVSTLDRDPQPGQGALRSGAVGTADDAIQVDSDPDVSIDAFGRLHMPIFGQANPNGSATIPPSSSTGTIRGRRQTYVGASSGGHRNAMDQHEDDAQVEGVLVVDYDGEQVNGLADEHGVLASGLFTANNPSGSGRPDTHTMYMDDTVSHPNGIAGANSAPSIGNRNGRLRIEAPRRPISMSDSDREGREFAEASTPLNNTFMEMANTLMSTVEQAPSGLVSPPAAPSATNIRGSSDGPEPNNANPFSDSDDQDVELELDDGTEAEENGRASSSGSGSGSNGLGIEGNLINGEGGVALAAPASAGRAAGVAGAKRKR